MNNQKISSDPWDFFSFGMNYKSLLMISKNWFYSLFIVLVLFNCKESKPAITASYTDSSNYFDAKQVLSHVAELSSDSYEGRLIGTKGSEKARTYIKKTFKKHGVKPFKENFEQSFIAKLKDSTVEGTNVLGYVEGSEYPDQFIVISAHYDHVGVRNNEVYNGADDNASGVGALLALAEYLKTNTPKHSVILASFDSEEFGLQGAKHFVAQAKKEDTAITFNINMDMISRSPSNEIYAVGQLTQKELQPLIKGLELPDNFTIAEGHEGNDGTRNWLYASDHTPFYRSGIPVLYFGVDDHPDYHKATDDFERIDKDFYLKAVEVVIKTFDTIDAFYK